MRALLLPTLALLVGCGGGTSVELTLTMPNGTVSKQTLSDSTGFLLEGSGRATASFPELGTWDKSVPLGVSARLFPLQPGRYGTSGNLHLGADTVAAAKALTLDVTVDRVRWQNDGAHPFRLEGTLSGTSNENHKVEGRFSTTMNDCSDKVAANAGQWLCGLPFPSSAYKEQRWTIAGWTIEGDCPDAVFKRFAGGPTLTLDSHFASMGGSKQLQCVVTYGNANKVVCGASDENVQADGCTWSVTAFATPGVVTVTQPRLVLAAGTLGSCAPKTCLATPSSLTHVSGATTSD